MLIQDTISHVSKISLLSPEAVIVGVVHITLVGRIWEVSPT